MKCITICQPYAHLIAAGEKFVENRSWPTKHRGWLAIHAGKSKDYMGPDDHKEYPGIVFGAIVAVAWMSMCVDIDGIKSLIDQQKWYSWLPDHEHTEGPYCWVLSNIYPLRSPLKMSGKQGLFELDMQITAQLHPLMPKKPLVPGAGC